LPATICSQNGRAYSNTAPMARMGLQVSNVACGLPGQVYMAADTVASNTPLRASAPLLELVGSPALQASLGLSAFSPSTCCQEKFTNTLTAT